MDGKEIGYHFFGALVTLILVNRYPYPIFDILSTWQRLLLFTFSSLLMSGSTMALKWLYGKLNGVDRFQNEAVKNPAGVRTKGE